MQTTQPRGRSGLRGPGIGAAAALLVLALLTTACATTAPHSLEQHKAELVGYVDSGSYSRDIEREVARARRYLENQAEDVERPAMVLDIDETSLSNWEYELRTRFCYSSETWEEWVEEAAAPAIEPTLDLFRFARENDVAVFFISARKQSSQEHTERNLEQAGYADWTGLYLKPDDYHEPSAVGFKTSARREITGEGYTIVISLGDQKSDLTGGFSARTFRLPNPFYVVP